MRSCYYYSLHIVDCYTYFGCYTQNFLAIVLFGLLQVPFVILSNLSGVLNLTLGGISHQLLFAFFTAIKTIVSIAAKVSIAVHNV